MARQKLEKSDGLGPLEIKKIRMAVRLVWHRSYARSLVTKRCTGKDGFFRCEKCKKKTPQLKIDHIKNVGNVDSGFIKRMFCSSSGLQGLCKTCHNEKTKQERKAMREKDHRDQTQDQDSLLNDNQAYPATVLDQE